MELALFVIAGLVAIGCGFYTKSPSLTALGWLLLFLCGYSLISSGNTEIIGYAEEQISNTTTQVNYTFGNPYGNFPSLAGEVLCLFSALGLLGSTVHLTFRG